MSKLSNAPFDAVLDHVARHELDATLKVFGKLLLRPVQVPNEGLEGIQLPEKILRRPGAVTAISPNKQTHTHTNTGQTVTLLERGGGRGVEGRGCDRCGGGC